MAETDVHLIRVTTDDREHQLWVASCRREDAIDNVLNAIPEGWTAALLSTRLKPQEVEVLSPGEMRQLTIFRPDLPPKAN
jgi:hypothetical protein